MNKTIKKVTVAAAVAAAMGMAAGAAQAITLGQYATASLVPYVLYDSANSVDTAIGVTTRPTGGIHNTVPMSGAACTASTCGLLHWYFFNSRSCHEADGPMPITSNDFVGFMWGDLARQAVTGGCTQAKLDGMKGYMILVSEDGMASGANPSLPIVSDAAMITGNWAAAAFIPTVPLLAGNWGYSGYYPDVYAATTSNLAVVNTTDGTFLPDLDMRYYVSGLGQRTDLVIWVDKNHKASSSDSDYIVSAFTYDENEVGNSTGVKINDELNVIRLTNTSSEIGFVTTKGSGFITMAFPGDTVLNQGLVGAVGYDNIVAFSLIYTNASGSAQTILAHERY